MTAIFTTPAIMSGPMIRALLDGRKSQTRRLVTSQWANLKMHHELGEPCFVWVRDSWLCLDGQKYYKACTTPDGDDIRKEYGAKWDPSIHMPRGASRLTLEVTDVWLQKLQDISEADALAEGDPDQGLIASENAHRDWYQSLWDHLHGKGSWDANPEIVAISFRVHQQNIDALLADRGMS